MGTAHLNSLLENMDDFNDRVEFIEGDIRDRETMDRAVAGCAAIFHQAALGSVPRSVEDPATSHDVNVNGTLTLLEAARNRLMSLRYFGMVRFGSGGADWGLARDPTAPEDTWDVELEVEETNTRQFQVGAGLSTDGGAFGQISPMQTLGQLRIDG